MARRPAAPLPKRMPPLALTEPRTEVKRKLEEQIRKGEEIQHSLSLGPITHLDPLFPKREVETYRRDITAWSEYNEALLKRVFTSEGMAQEYRHSGCLGPMPFYEQQIWRILKETADNNLAKLRSIVQRLEFYDESAEQAASTRQSNQSNNPQKIFVVHGHDDTYQAVARFMEQLGLKVIVLNEQPDQGFTIIEKFEKHAEVGFAVVLLTPDDLAQSGTTSQQTHRARQNVIFELGYFAAKLGRGRTCLIRKGDVEIPSDLYGIIYTDFDAAGGWKTKLGAELKAAGLDFDPARMFK